MGVTVLVEASPRVVSTGATTSVRLAGGTSGRPFTQLGFSDWRGGVADIPKFTALIGFDQSGLTSSAIAQTAGIRFAPSSSITLSTLAALHWLKARITIKVGDDEAPTPAYPLVMTGTVAAAKVSGGALNLTFSDLTSDLDKPVCPDTFAGTGDLEGAADALGRIKRRSFGQVYNIEGRLLDKAYNIFEFGDPSKPLQGMPGLYDKGLAGTTTTQAWAGSQAATLAALRAATVPEGGGIVCPSLACARWWTVPAGPLTADLLGEVGGAYVDTAPAIAARIAVAFSSSITVSNLAAALAWQSAKAGVHVDSSSETAANVLDRLLFPVSTVWTLAADGTFSFRELKWTGSVETIGAQRIEREVVFQPLKTRNLGYQRNHREQSDSEISAALTSLPTTGENLVYNPDLALGADNWTLAGGVSWAAAAAGAPTPGILSFPTGSSTADANRGIKFPTGGAKTLYGNLNVFRPATATGTLAIVVSWFKADGTASSTASTSLSVFPATTGAWQKGVGGAFTVPTDAASWTVRIAASTGGSGALLVGGLRIATSQPAADNTAANQVTFATVTTTKDIPFDYTGTTSTALPATIAAPRVVQGGQDITTQDITSHSIANAAGGCSGNVSVDNATGSTTKGLVTIGTGFAANGSYDHIVTVSGVAQPAIKVTVNKVKAAAPTGGGGGGGGGGGTAGGTFSSSSIALTSTSDVEVGRVSGLTVTSGQTIHGSFSDGIALYGTTGFGVTTRTPRGRWRYSPAGAGTWTDFGSNASGTAASYNGSTGESISGDLTVNQTASPPAGSYDVAFFASLTVNMSVGNAVFDGATQSVSVS